MGGVQVAGTIMCWWYSQAMYLWGVVDYDITSEPPFSILKKKTNLNKDGEGTHELPTT